MATPPNETNLATAKTVLSTAASVAATVMLARSVAQDILPYEFHDYFLFNIRKILGRFSSQITMVVDEFDGFVHNQIYEAAETYLASNISPSTQRFKVSKPEKEKNLTVKMEGNEEIIDVYRGVKFKWIFVCSQVESRNLHHPFDHNATLRSEVRSFEVSFPKKHKEMALESYLPHIVREAESMVQEKKTLRIFSVDYDNIYGNLADAWKPVNLDHPATFQTLALDAQLKGTILEDLERFVKRKDYYRKVGKAWKRGYLLYGPPGTGKSSLIAAMANYLKFDIYDLELTELRCNSELRKLLIATANRSILVVEDIDCTIEFQDRLAEANAAEFHAHYPPQKQVTLSGLLNFIDGLWSSCGDERIIIFTTNHKEKLDPALLRPGRMDVHVHMSYCTPCGFRLLAANYLGIKDHHLFGRIEDLILTAQVTPAEVAEQLLRSDELETVLSELIQFLEVRKKEITEQEKADQKELRVDEKEGQSRDQGDCVEDKKANDDDEKGLQCLLGSK
ncbi:AAA-ATPase At3g50940 [Ricinus communis]|uniref:AAA-ATPase At3g50940 n=1 Tax=Ricinus communis TaxID=3988 RepID=UPI00201A37C5|nr:AAA-ATPase At3g50940 [Ricinus communis]